MIMNIYNIKIFDTNVLVSAKNEKDAREFLINQILNNSNVEYWGQTTSDVNQFVKEW